MMKDRSGSSHDSPSDSTVDDGLTANAIHEGSSNTEGAIARFEHEAIPSLPDVARFARSLTRDVADADDLVQETYLRAFRAWHTFEPGSDCRRWLFTICRNIFLRGREKESRMVSVDDPEAEALGAVRLHIQARDAGLDDMFTRLDVAPAIERALSTLSESFREVVQLVDIQGFAYEEAADALGVPVGTIRSRLFRARRLLQAELIEYARDLGYKHDAAQGRTPPEETGR